MYIIYIHVCVFLFSNCQLYIGAPEASRIPKLVPMTELLKAEVAMTKTTSMISVDGIRYHAVTSAK